jgi:hypothetical protein
VSPPARRVEGPRRGPLEDPGGFPGYEEIMDALAGPAHPGHAAHCLGVADLTGSDTPLNPAFMDIPAVSRTMANQF